MAKHHRLDFEYTYVISALHRFLPFNLTMLLVLYSFYIGEKASNEKEADFYLKLNFI